MVGFLRNRINFFMKENNLSLSENIISKYYEIIEGFIEYIDRFKYYEENRGTSQSTIKLRVNGKINDFIDILNSGKLKPGRGFHPELDIEKDEDLKILKYIFTDNVVTIEGKIGKDPYNTSQLDKGNIYRYYMEKGMKKKYENEWIPYLESLVLPYLKRVSPKMDIDDICKDEIIILNEVLREEGFNTRLVDCDDYRLIFHDFGYFRKTINNPRIELLELTENNILKLKMNFIKRKTEEKIKIETNVQKCIESMNLNSIIEVK